MIDDDGTAPKYTAPDDPSHSSKQQLSRFFDLSLDLFCVASTDGFFKEINPAFETVLGYSRSELLSRSFMEFVHSEDRDATREAVEQLAQGLPVVDFQNRYRAADGTYRWFAWRSAPDPEGVLIYAVARDITEGKKAEQIMKRQAAELARSNADLEQFASVASHDLRAPLRAVSNLVAWIEEDMPEELPASVQQNLEKLKEQVDRMQRLTEDLLRYARAGQTGEQDEEVSVKALIDELVALISPPDGFQVELEEPAPTFRTSRAALAQVLQNLISNAIDHHDQNHGRIDISVTEKPRSYSFRVKDDGPGIPDDFSEDLFKMFSRRAGPNSRKGTGIGLALVKRIVESRGGRVEVLPAETRGSVFLFTWPKASREGTQ